MGFWILMSVVFSVGTMAGFLLAAALCVAGRADERAQVMEQCPSNLPRTS